MESARAYPVVDKSTTLLLSHQPTVALPGDGAARNLDDHVDDHHRRRGSPASRSSSAPPSSAWSRLARQHRDGPDRPCPPRRSVSRASSSAAPASAVVKVAPRPLRRLLPSSPPLPPRSPRARPPSPRGAAFVAHSTAPASVVSEKETLEVAVTTKAGEDHHRREGPCPRRSGAWPLGEAPERGTEPNEKSRAAGQRGFSPFGGDPRDVRPSRRSVVATARRPIWNGIVSDDFTEKVSRMDSFFRDPSTMSPSFMSCTEDAAKDAAVRLEGLIADDQRERNATAGNVSSRRPSTRPRSVLRLDEVARQCAGLPAPHRLRRRNWRRAHEHATHGVEHRPSRGFRT